MENLQSCELCLTQTIKTEDLENLHCDEKQNLNILKSLDITVSKDAKICSNCVNISHMMYNFKMSCLTNNDHLITLIHPGINDRLILEEVIVRETKSEVKNEEKVCRFCLNFSEVSLLMEVNLEQDVVLKDMLRRCLPEIDTNMVQNPLICSICSELLEKLFHFFSQCEETEVLRNLDTKFDVLVNENKPTVANNDYNIDNSFVKEENCEGIENPELQIKSENSNIDEDIKDSINDSNCLLKESEIQKETSSISSESELYKCTECSFQSKYQSTLVRHKNRKTPCGNRCNKCSFTANNKREIVKHKKKHHKKLCLDTTKEKKFVCDICSYQTNTNGHLKQHSLIHKEPSEVNIFKCDYCPFATKWKRNLILHGILHKNPSEMPKFKCNDCPYETHNRRCLIDHALVHKNPAQANMYKCKVCSFQTKYKRYILVHRKKHQVEFYTCDECNYKSKSERWFTSHLRRHKESNQLAKSNQTVKKIRQYKCNKCWFVATHSTNLMRHQMTHKDPSEREKYNCTECSFQALYKITLQRHYKKHHSHLELPFGDLKTFQCNKCDFMTTDNKIILKHLQAHEQKKMTWSVKEELKEPDNMKDNEGT